jgi:magnesium-transporting ATPase (P-type)
VDESHLTGESDDVVKEPPSAASAAAAAAGSGGRNGSSEGVGGQLSSCLCMSGSKVLEGFGRMLVLAVGPNSQQVRCVGLCFESFGSHTRTLSWRAAVLVTLAGVNIGAFVHVVITSQAGHACCGLHSGQYCNICSGASHFCAAVCCRA